MYRSYLHLISNVRSSFLFLYQIHSIDFVSSGGILLRVSAHFFIFVTNEWVSTSFVQLVSHI